MPGGSAVKNPPANAGELSSIPGSGRSHGEGNGYPLQYFCLEDPQGRGPWWATVYGVMTSWTRLSNFTFTCRNQSIATTWVNEIYIREHFKTADG